MKILCLEFTTHLRSTAVMEGTPGSEWISLGGYKDTDPNLKRRDGKTALVMAEEALQQGKVSPAHVDAIIVSVGPGSFTGIRSAIALAQGWQAARGTKVLGVTSLFSLNSTSEFQNAPGTSAIVIDAQKGEFNYIPKKAYASQAELSDAIQLFPKAHLLEKQEAGEMFFGPHLKKHFPNSTEIYPDAEDLARSIPVSPDWQCASDLEAIYLRKPDFIKAPPPRVIPDIA